MKKKQSSEQPRVGSKITETRLNITHSISKHLHKLS